MDLLRLVVDWLRLIAFGCGFAVDWLWIGCGLVVDWLGLVLD